MKQIILITIFLFLCFLSSAQEIRGSLLKVSFCKFTDSGQISLRTEKCYNTFVTITDEVFKVRGERVNVRYELYDKQIENSDTNNVVIHYLSDSYKQSSLVGIKECDNNIVVGIFPMDGSEKFKEFHIKPFLKKQK